MKLFSLSVAGVVAMATLALGAFAILPKMAQAKPKSGDVPVIVELFTSEGCSSCPSADSALIELSQTQPVPGANIIALGYHVDYWNHLGWRDPFSSATYSQRQETYRQHFGNDSVYTPQVIVSGTTEFVGSDTGRARNEIAHAADRLRKSTVMVSITPSTKDAYTVAVTGELTLKSPHLFVAVTETGLSTEVKRGENAGRHLAHVAVVRRLIPLGNKRNATVSLPVVSGEQRDNQKIVAWVQDGDSGAIAAATQAGR